MGTKLEVSPWGTMKRSTAMQFRTRGPPSSTREELIRRLEEEERATLELERRLEGIINEKLQLEDDVKKLSLVLEEARDILSEYMNESDFDFTEDDDGLSKMIDKEEKDKKKAEEKEEKERKKAQDKILKNKKKGKSDNNNNNNNNKDDDDNKEDKEANGSDSITILVPNDRERSGASGANAGVITSGCASASGGGGGVELINGSSGSTPGELEVTVIKNWKKADQITIEQLREMGEKALIEQLSQKEKEKSKSKDKVKDKDAEKFKDKKSSKEMKDLKKMVSATIKKKDRKQTLPDLGDIFKKRLSLPAGNCVPPPV